MRQQKEITVFIILISIILMIFIIGIIVFILHYRQRKLLYVKEKGKMEEKHRADLLNNQLEIQQQTMQFIGRELHDSVAQKLTLASIYTQRLEFEQLYPAMTDQLKSISNIINDSLLELRDLSRNLTESNLDNAGLTDLLVAECERVNNTGVCKAMLHAAADVAINISVKCFLLRTTQEFIQNSLKHSDCHQIDIRLATDDKNLLLDMTDDGKGFDITATKSRGIGLNNMRRRIQVIGGDFALQSEPGKGTALHIAIPKQQLQPSFA